MRELSLFSGAGGGLLGTYLLGWQPVGYVEWDDYCQRVIAARIADGILPAAPIFGDIRAFTSDGYAAAYTGLVDVITGGFPCQPFSVAGKRAGADDERNMWPATIECIRVVRPRFCLLENVPGLLTSGYFGTVLGDLAESGYDVRWRVLSAAEVGAPHKRDRLWIAANTNSKRWQGSGSKKVYRIKGLPWGKNLRSIEDIVHRPDIPKPLLCGVGEWTANRVERLRAIGNGQVPAVVRAAWLLLNEVVMSSGF